MGFKDEKNAGSVTDGRALVIRGTLHWVIALMVVMNLFFSVALLVSVAYGLKVIRELGLKPPVVLAASAEKTTILNPSVLVHTGPLDVELQSMAWDAVRLIAGADSTDAAVYYQQSKQLMTTACRKAFEREIEPSVKDIVDLKIYRILEVKQFRALNAAADRGADSQDSIDRYELVVSGTVKTYRLGGNELLMSGPFCYRVEMVPTQRSINNPRGILLSRISPWKGDSDAPKLQK